MLKIVENAKKLAPKKVKDDLLKFLLSIDDVIKNLNIKQLEQGEGADDKPLKNANSKYSGVYSKTTELIALKENPIAPKKAGKKYNFLYHGEFIKNFELFQNGDKLDIFSTGTGSGNKKAFFDGYSNLYSLNTKSKRIVIEKHLKKFLIEYYRYNLIK